MSGVWFDLVMLLIGGGLLQMGVTGLIMGGNMPFVPVPQQLRPLAKFLQTIASFVGMTIVLEKGTADLAERIVQALL